LYLHLLADSDIHLPVFRSADLHRRTTIATSGLRWNHRRSKRAIACSIRGDVKNILLPPPEARLWFAASSPLSD